MTEHLETEVLSAHIDDALDERAGQGAIQHLAGCHICAERLRELQSLAASLGEMPGVEPTAQESRKLREAIVDARASRVRSGVFGAISERIGSRSKPSAQKRGGLVAVIALVLIAVAALAALVPLRDGDPQKVAGPENAVLGVATAAELRSAVSNDPRVRERAEGLTVSDVADERSVPLPSLGGDLDDATPSPGVWAEGSDEVCADKVLESQPYPMVPVYARKATFQGKPAWLLVYLWSTSSEDEAPLDRVQAWMFSPQDCLSYSGQELVSKALHYSFFKL